MDISKELATLVRKLDGAAGRLIVPAAHEPLIKDAMEAVCEVSIRLSEIAEKVEEDEHLPKRLEVSE